ncbi:Serine/threonine-protein kinase haspin [Branchiostoma belcheri]|nr:Serine/threonine-protein kinase haspin [Branchiostoma belcheri]
MGKPSWLNNVTSSTIKKARVYTTKKNRKKVEYNTRVVDNTWEQVCKFNLGDISPFSLDSPESVPEKRPGVVPWRKERLGGSPEWPSDRGTGLWRKEDVNDAPCEDVTSLWSSRNRAVSTSPCSNKENSSLKNSQPLRSKRVSSKKKSLRVQSSNKFDLDHDSDSDFVPSQPKKRKAPTRQKKACSKKGKTLKGKKSKKRNESCTKAPVENGQYFSDFEVHSNAHASNLSGLNHFTSQESMNFGNSENVTNPSYSNLIGDTSPQNDKSSLYLSSHNHNSSYFDELVRHRLDQFVTRDRKANTPLSFTSPFEANSNYETPPSQVQQKSPGAKRMQPVVMLSNISKGELMESSDVVLAEVSPSSSEMSRSPKEACALDVTSSDFVVPESPIEQDSSKQGTDLSPEATVFRTSTPFAEKGKYNLRKQASETKASGTRKRPARGAKESNRDRDTPPPKRRRAKSRNAEDNSQKIRKTRTLRTRQKKSSNSVTPCSVLVPRLSEKDIQRLSSGNKLSRKKQQSGNVRESKNKSKKQNTKKKTPPKKRNTKNKTPPKKRNTKNKTQVQQRQKSSTESFFKTPDSRAVYTPDACEHLSPAGFLAFTPGSRGNKMGTSHRAKSPGSGVKQTPLRGAMGLPSRHGSMMSPLFKKAVQNRVRISPKEKLLLHCDKERILTFQECIPGAMMERCVKIGEGVFGEVFRTRRDDGSSVALKIIPIEGDFPVNDEPQKTFEEILPEIVISRELSELKDGTCNQTGGFIHLHRVCLVQGAWPDHLLAMWDQWHQEKAGGSENDKPDMFPDSQLFVVLEFADGGCDLEHFQFHSLSQAKAVLHQITIALAVAEAALQFEHRDLHWGNVLVRKVEEQSSTHHLAGEEVCVATSGLDVNIIDFTLSRMQKDGQPLYCDLSADPTLFEGKGDYQFDIYREMKKENQDNWKRHHPYTNVLWLHYLADKLLNKKYRAIKKSQRQWQQKFRTFLKQVLACRTVAQVLEDCQLFKEK